MNARSPLKTILPCCIAFIMILMILFLPWLRYSTALYTKKSANTFVGDEKYTAVKEEVEQVAAEYTAQGMVANIEEQVTERVNSKGVTTSMITFSIVAAQSLTGWQLLSRNMPFSRLLWIFLISALLALILNCLIWAQLPAANEGPHHGRSRFLRLLPPFLSLLVLFLILLFMTNVNLELSRNVTIALSGNFEQAKAAAIMDRLDHFLYGGTAGEQIPAFLGSLSYSLNPLIFLLLIQAILLLLGSLSTCYGRVLAPLLRILLYVTVFLFSLFILYPFFVMFITAFRSNAEATDMYFLHILPTKWVWSNLRDTLDRGVLRYLLNSLLIAGGATLIAMFCGIPAAYAMARMNFRGKKAYLGFVIMSQMFSPVVLLVGISRLMNTLHLNDSLIGLMLINAAFNQAFAIWLLRGTFVSISSEMEQAACIDGCSTLGALLQILLPIAAPGIVTTLIFVFINSWNEYTISTVLISTQTNRPITVGITQFSSFNMIEWQYLFASALLATIPVVILFMCIEKHLAAGLTAGGVKG